jgi:hypothetical protein
MAVGESGRIVIDVDPDVKRRLYSALALSGSTLKDWFLKNASNFCNESQQPQLFTEPGTHPKPRIDGRQKKSDNL